VAGIVVDPYAVCIPVDGIDPEVGFEVHWSPVWIH
jgi:hypothetical protein